MIWHLLAVFISGLALGGFGFLLIKISGNRLPKWIMPVAAGMGMLGYQAYYNYAWYDFKLGQLPERTIVIDVERNSDFFRPWSYFYPAVSNFTFIDNDVRVFEQDGQQLVQYIYFEMHQEHLDRLESHFYLLNCNKAEQVELDDKGKVLEPAIFKSLERSGLLFQTLCTQNANF